MSTLAAKRRARWRWRQKRRDAGMSWFCVALNHAVCSGWLGRLVRRDQVRPACTCPCHKEELEWSA